MGLLMFLGMMGAIGYSAHIIKNDVQAEVTDYKTKPTFNRKKNKKIINTNFKNICKRSGIKFQNGYPVSDNKIDIAIEYLQYQGYDEGSIQYFKNIFYKKYNAGQKQQKEILNNKIKQLLTKAQNKACTDIVVYRVIIYSSSLSPTERMDKILSNKLWKKIVARKSYIRSNSGKWEEIWTLKVPNDFFYGVDKDELYRNICKMQNVEYGF